MKNIIAITLILISIACGSKKNNVLDIEKYSVTKIDSLENYYIIYTKQKGQNYKIVSEKSTSQCRNKILVGRSYNLKTESIFTMKIMVKDSIREISNNVNIKCMTLQNTMICKEYENGIYDVRKSENLKGICYSNIK